MSNLTAKSLEPHDQPLMDKLTDRWNFSDSMNTAVELATKRSAEKMTGPGAFFHKETQEKISANRLSFAQRGAARIPWNLLRKRSGADAIVRTTNTFDDFATIFNDYLILPELGAQEFQDLTGEFRIPRQTEGGTADGTWSDDSSSISSTTAALEISSARSCTLMIKRFALRSSEGTRNGGKPVGDYLEKEFASQLGRNLLSAALNGSGASGVPRGLLQIAADSGSDVASHALDSTGIPSYSDLIAIEKLHADSRALSSRSAWICSPSMLQSLRSVADSNGHPVVQGGDGGLNLLGYRLRATSSCPNNRIIFGDFSGILLLFFGPSLDLLADPFTSGGLRVDYTLLAYVNILVQKPEGLVVGS